MRWQLLLISSTITLQIVILYLMAFTVSKVVFVFLTFVLFVIIHLEVYIIFRAKDDVIQKVQKIIQDAGEKLINKVL